MKKLLLTFLAVAFLLTVFIVPCIANAQSGTPIAPTVNYEKVNMENGISYLLKRAKEKVILFILSYNPQKKLNYYEKLLDVRLAELKFIVDNKDIANIQVSSQRYFSTAGQMTSFVLSKPELSSQKENLKKIFEKHIDVIENLMTSYKDTTAEWRFLRDDVNYLKDYSALLK